MMRVLVLLCCIAAASAAVTEPRVLLKLSPLIGGPKLLRVHSQLFVDSGNGLNGWDFVPKDATAPATLARLVTLRAAPGDARRLVANDGVGMFDVGPAASSADIDAALAARSKDLHLVSNNCWSHTVDAAAAALGTDRGGAVRALVGAVLRRRPWRPVARPPVARQKRTWEMRPPSKVTNLPSEMVDLPPEMVDLPATRLGSG